ncbi:MAG: hypothetical protein H6707_02715 [Deltaproteobacteria bacterium]|nr:hypothetical protein [Deltaproteobacteria bacterium]
MRFFLISLACSIFAACGTSTSLPDPQINPPTKPKPWVNRAPTLMAASPAKLAVGEQLTIIGDDFISSDYGVPYIKFVGTFTDDQGASYPVDLQIETKRTNSGKLTWSLWPNIVFHPQGDRLGTFVGDIQVLNVGNDGSQKLSDPLPTTVEIGPSLIPLLAQPKKGGCQPVVTSTLGDTGYQFQLRAVGLRAATQSAPLVFSWTFLAEQWVVGPHGLLDYEKVFPKSGGIGVEQVVTSGTETSLSDDSDASALVKIGREIMGDKGVAELKLRAVEGEGNGYQATVFVSAVDGGGKRATLRIPIDVHRQAEMFYNGESKVAQRWESYRVTDCLAGADIGRQVTYREDKTEQKSRAIAFQYNASLGVGLGLPSNPFALSINPSVGFGVDVQGVVSTQKMTGIDLGGQLLAGNFGVFYRQLTKVYKIGKLRGYGVCGESVDLGEVVLTDWIYTPEFAQGQSCPPPSNLAPAVKYLD